jgi:hypothetical protein
MAVSPNVRAALLLLVALVLALSGAWLATSTASPSAAPGHREGPLIKWRGTGAKATLPLRADRLPAAPRAFRKFVRSQLHQLWGELGHEPGCKSAPLITVHALRTDGFALGGVNTIPSHSCKDAGGGYEAIWAIRHGAWKQVLGTQEVIACAKLERLGIPSEIGVHECYQGGQVVPYDHP